MQPLTVHPPSEVTFGLDYVIGPEREAHFHSTSHQATESAQIQNTQSTPYASESVTRALIAEGFRVFPKRASLDLTALYLQPEDAPSCCGRANESNPFFKGDSDI